MDAGGGVPIVTGGDILLLDEPSMGLAPVLVDEIFDKIVAINKRGTTVLLVDQNASVALHIANFVYVLEAVSFRQGCVSHQISWPERDPESAVKKSELFENQVKKQFIDEPGQMKLLIVVDKLLTGFDTPSATYLYIDKHMQDHGLFQAICQVHRLDWEQTGLAAAKLIHDK